MSPEKVEKKIRIKVLRNTLCEGRDLNVGDVVEVSESNARLLAGSSVLYGIAPKAIILNATVSPAGVGVVASVGSVTVAG